MSGVAAGGEDMRRRDELFDGCGLVSSIKTETRERLGSDDE